MDKKSPPTGSIKILKRVSIKKSPWIQLERIFYKHPDSDDNDTSDSTDIVDYTNCDDTGAPVSLQKNIRYWDVFSRRALNHSSQPNSATVLALCYKLEDNSYSFFLSVVEQYRPSVNVNTLEFPSGICDLGEEITDCAFRELKEETGFTGVIVRKSPNLPTTVLGNDNTCLVTALVDLNLDGNINPVQQLEPTESITSHLFPLCNLLETLEAYCSKYGCSMADNLYLFCYSISLLPYEVLYDCIVKMVSSSNH